MANKHNSLSHTKWMCKYHIVYNSTMDGKLSKKKRDMAEEILSGYVIKRCGSDRKVSECRSSASCKTQLVSWQKRKRHRGLNGVSSQHLEMRVGNVGL